MSLISAQNFHSIAKEHSKKILIILGFLWVCLIITLFKLPIEKSSTAFFPDNTKPLQSMIKAMEMASFSQNIYIDFESTSIPLKELANHIQELEKNLDPSLVLPATQQSIPEPQSILEFLPAWFDASMEQEFQKLISEENIKQDVQNAQSILLGFPSMGTTDWLRHDPLGLSKLVLKRLPNHESITSKIKINEDYGYAVSNDNKHLLLTLQPKQSIHETEFALKLMHNLEQAMAQLPPQIKTNIIGAVRHTVANTKAIDADILWISIVSILGLVLIYAIFIRSMGGIWLLLTPCLAVSIALGTMHIFYGLVSGLAVGFGMSILGIAEDYAVHMHFALRSNKDKKIVFKALNTPLLQGFLLNASGFALLLFSALPAVRQLSAFAIVALFSGLILALYILPLCPGFDKPQKIEKEHKAIKQAYPKLMPVLSLSFVFVVMCLYLFNTLPIDVSPQSMGANAHAIQNDNKIFNKIWQINAPSLLLIDTDNNALALEKTRTTQAILEKELPHISFISLANLLPSTKNMQANIVRWNKFTQENMPYIKEKFNKYSNHMPANAVFEPFFTFLQTKPQSLNLDTLKQGPWGTLIQSLLQSYPQDKITQSRIIADTTLSSKEIPAALNDQVTLFTPQGLEQNLRAVFFDEAKYLPLMFICCLVLLFLCFKNIPQTLLAALPALAALFCIFLTMHFWQKPLTLASLAAMPLVLGLSIDHGILATHHLAKGIALQMNRAIMVSSLTACVSMGMLAFATHPTLQAMGHVVFVGLLVEMPVAIWLLPKLCKGLDNEV